MVKRKTFVNVGDRFQNKLGNWCEVIQVNKWDDVIVRFENTSTVKSFQADSLKRGIFHDPYNKAYWGFGYIGVGKYSGKTHKSAFNTWMHMVERCYDSSCKYYPLYGGKGVRVSNEWVDFQVFAKWFDENKVDGWHMDKDFINPFSKIYSKETCVFIPPAVNGLFTGYQNGLKNMGTGRTRQGKWYSNCTIDGEQQYLGVSDTWLEAKTKYLVEKRKVAEKIMQKYDLPLKVKQTLYEMTSIYFYLD
jgi:hypothetical protein